VEGLESVSYEERVRTLGVCSLVQRRLRVNLTTLYSFLRRGSGEGGADLFSLGSSDRMQLNDSKPQALRNISLLRGWSNT